MIIGITDVATLETLACREGLALAEDLLLQNFIIASDSKQIINDIDKASNGNYGAIIHEIKTRASAFNCNFSFEGRAANHDADSLAKYSHSLDQGRHVWMSVPHDPFCIPQVVVFEQ